MAVPTVTTYAVGAGQPIHAGRWPGGALSGVAALSGVVASGVLGRPPELAGTAALGAVTASGSMAMYDPRSAVLDIIAAAYSASGGLDTWAQLNAGQNTMQDVFAPAGLTSQLGPSGQERIQGAWPSIAWSSSRHSLIIWGGGHANSPTGQVFEWKAETRQWTLAYHQADLVQVSAVPRYRSPDFITPVASHTYGNNNWLPVLQRFWTFGGAAYGDGGTLRVYDTNIPGNQSPLRAVGAYTLDMTLAGQGYVAGATGTNVHGSGYATTDLTGANAWVMRDWFSLPTSNPARPRASGVDQDSHINMGTDVLVEGGKDVVYYTATSGTSRLLFKCVVNSATDFSTDVNTWIASQGIDNSAQGQGPLAVDPVRRVVVKMNNAGRGAGGAIEFVDLKRTWGATNGWRAATLTGPDVLEFANTGVSLINAGIYYSTVKGCFVVWAMGRQVWEIYPPNSAAYVDNSNTNLTADTGWSVVKTTMYPSSAAPRSNYVVDAVLGETGTLGKWRRADDLGGVGIATFGNRAGEVWAHIPAGWTDPRS